MTGIAGVDSRRTGRQGRVACYVPGSSGGVGSVALVRWARAGVASGGPALDGRGPDSRSTVCSETVQGGEAAS